MADEVVDSGVDSGKAADTTQSTKTVTADTTRTDSSQSTASDVSRKAEEERNRGILADLQKERKSRQEWERKAQAHETELALERRRVQALSGVNPRSDEDTNNDLVRQRLEALYPALGKLTPQQVERLLAVADKADSLEESNLSGWKRHGTQMLDQVTASVAKVVGGTLSERQATALKRAYVQEAEANPEFLARHEAGDPKLVEEFAKAWIDDWFEPARRSALNKEVERQKRVPSARDRSVAGPGGKKLDYNDPKAVEDALVESFRSHGGEFGG